MDRSYVRAVERGPGAAEDATPMMTSAERAQLLPALQARRTALTDRWYMAIAHTSFTPYPAAAVRLRLAAMGDQAIAALLSEPVARAQAREVGAALPELHYIQPTALSSTLEVLADELMADLSPQQVQGLQPHLAALLSEIAAGFYAHSRTLILEEQDQMRRALFVTREHAARADEARAAAEEAVRVRDSVLNAAAHDLRAPLTIILGQVDLMRLRLGRGEPPPLDWLRTRVASMHTGALRMTGMVEELLDAARLQLGQTLDLHVEPVDIGALAQSTAAEIMATTEEAPQVMVDMPAAAVVVEGDTVRLARVLHNVIGNAVKYSADGDLPVQVAVCAEADGAAVRVQDHGVGIPADELPRIFTPFYRASTAQQKRGTGLGLVGAKAIVEQHGGHLTLESALGEGTTVVITLPWRQPRCED